MRNYDEIEDFIDYTNKDEWKSYIENSVIPLWETVKIIKEFQDELTEFHNLNLDQLDTEDKKLVLGGIRSTGDEKHTRNSLAKFYDLFFGLRVKDIDSWLESEKAGEKLTEIKLEVLETGFTKFIDRTNNILESAISHQYLITDYKEPSLDYEELKKYPDKLLEIIPDFYQRIIDISANHNYHTFFLNSVNQIPKMYMTEAYPRIDNIFDFLIDDFGLTELDWSNPFDPESSAYENYILYSFPEYNPKKGGASFGGSICRLNELIWTTFDMNNNIKDALKMVFRDVRDFKDEFINKVNVKNNCLKTRTIYLEGILAYYGDDEERKSFQKILTEMFPCMFLGLTRIWRVTDEFLEFGPPGYPRLDF